MAKTIETETPVVNIIGVGTSIKGDINSNGDIRIDGSLTGSVITKGKVVVGKTGTIEGEIVCNSADISGIVKAKIAVTELLSMTASAKVNGDIVAGKFAVESGANFTGTCNMSQDKSYKPEATIKTPDEKNKNPY
ncbi:MAG: polymer-forming cytoskeletal protein [Bacteroidales bacterium]|jgi:cytoskeletal protein CcmA (bactofilin family)|nr:polymer-forming cytoskeletal protein [Bacteroidales bacterium]